MEPVWRGDWPFEMFPIAARDGLSFFSRTDLRAVLLLLTMGVTSQTEYRLFPRDTEILGASLKDLERILSDWQRQPSEAPRHRIEISGFPRELKGPLQEAMRIVFPGGISGTVRKITYEDESKSGLLESGRETSVLASFNGSDLSITLYRRPQSSQYPLFTPTPADEFTYILAHEFGHSIDPRMVAQNIPPAKQLYLVLKWEEVRRETGDFSVYERTIQSFSRAKENRKKSLEGFAESVAFFFTDPYWLIMDCPKRFQFFAKVFNIMGLPPPSTMASTPIKRKIIALSTDFLSKQR